MVQNVQRVQISTNPSILLLLNDENILIFFKNDFNPLIDKIFCLKHDFVYIKRRLESAYLLTVWKCVFLIKKDLKETRTTKLYQEKLGQFPVSRDPHPLFKKLDINRKRKKYFLPMFPNIFISFRLCLFSKRVADDAHEAF